MNGSPDSPDLHYVTDRPVRMVYVAGPMRLGNPNINVSTALNAGMDLMRAGWTPIMPQLSNLWEIAAGIPVLEHEDGTGGWLEHDFRMISRCDALVRLPGKSTGADREVALALTLGIPVLTLHEAMVVASHPLFGKPGNIPVFPAGLPPTATQE